MLHQEGMTVAVKGYVWGSNCCCILMRTLCYQSLAKKVQTCNQKPHCAQQSNLNCECRFIRDVVWIFKAVVKLPGRPCTWWPRRIKIASRLFITLACLAGLSSILRKGSSLCSGAPVALDEALLRSPCKRAVDMRLTLCVDCVMHCCSHASRYRDKWRNIWDHELMFESLLPLDQKLTAQCTSHSNIIFFMQHAIVSNSSCTHYLLRQSGCNLDVGDGRECVWQWANHNENKCYLSYEHVS